MAGRMDERGYAENGNERRRETLPRQEYDEEPRRMMRGNRRRDDRDAEREFERDDMADDRRHPPRLRRELREPLRMTSSLSDAFVTAFERGAQVWGENLRMYQDETVRFVTERLEQDTHMLEQLGKSRSMFDLLSIQQKWLSAATRAYSEEFMRLSKLTGAATQRAGDEQRQAMNEMRRSGYDAE
jgi:hypothetical protein